MEIFRRSRRHLPAEVFDEARWRAIVGEDLWPRAVTILNQGGRFEAASAAFKGDFHAHPYAKLLNLYQEKTASVIHSGTGKKHSGIARYIPIQDFHGNEPTTLRAGQDFTFITHRTISQTKSRTITNPWLTPMMPENALLINPIDAARLNLAEAQEVKVTRATNPTGEFNVGPGVNKVMREKIHSPKPCGPA
jgi:anaerobic selenocysteine-containing dehydrogenase